MTYLENTLCIMSALEDANKYYANYLQTKYSLKANESALYYSLASESFADKVKQFISKVVLYIIALFKRAKELLFKLFGKIKEILKKIKRFVDIKRGKEFLFSLDPTPIIKIAEVMNSEVKALNLNTYIKPVLEFAKNTDKEIIAHGEYDGPNKEEAEKLTIYSYGANAEGKQAIRRLDRRVDEFEEDIKKCLREFYDKLLNLIEPIEFKIIDFSSGIKESVPREQIYVKIDADLDNYRDFLESLEKEIVTFTKSLETPPVIHHAQRVASMIAHSYMMDVSNMYRILLKFFTFYWNSFYSKYDKELIQEKADDLKELALNDIRKYKSYID